MKFKSRWFTVSALLAGVFFFQSSSVGADTGELSPMQEAGRQEFNTYCVPCHGVDAKGSGVAAEALKEKPADLTQISARRGGKFDAAEVAQVIDGRANMPSHGSREMPIWGQRLGDDAAEMGDEESLTQGRVALLVAYLGSIQRPADTKDAKAAAAPSGDASQ